MTALIRATDLRKNFRKVRVLDGLNLEVPEGSVFGLIGPNGAGKTTTIKTLMNILQPGSGTAEVLGVDSRQLGPADLARIGYVSENQEMPDWMTVTYLLSYLKPFYPTWDDARAAELVRQFNLPGDRKLRQLSRGMWMKAALVSSLAYHPQLLVLDEPFSGLDPLVREDLIECLIESAFETTILISSHDLADMESFASHIAYLDRGRLQFSEEMTSLSARFREIEVTVEPPARLPAAGLADELAPARSIAEPDSFRRIPLRTGADGRRNPASLRGRAADFHASDAAPGDLPGPRARRIESGLRSIDMRQALHIFKKDSRYLTREIALFVVLAVLFAKAETMAPDPWLLELLLLGAAGYLIARLIHAEPIPGDRQFWITRPYGWKSLLAAKLLFIVVFISVPLFGARLFIPLAMGFPLGPIWPGLLWSQLLMLLCVWFPIAALAAVTSGLAPLIFAAFVFLLLGFSSVVRVAFADRLWPTSVDWVRNSVGAGALIAIALAILYVQYRSRRTVFSRASGLMALALSVVVYWSLPWPVGWAVQGWLSKQPFDGSTLQVALAPASTSRVIGFQKNKVEVVLPIAVRGIPDGATLRADAIKVRFQAPGGRVWEPSLYELPGIGTLATRSDSTVFAGYIWMDPGFFKEIREQPVTIHASLYFALFGNSRSKKIRLESKPEYALEGLLCFLGPFNSLHCRSPFRWPARLVYAQMGDNLSPLTQTISYSPFPGTVELNSMEDRWTNGPPPSDPNVTIVVKEPLTYFRRDFDVAGVRLAAYSRVQK